MTSPVETDWLAVPDLVATLGESVGRVHRLIDENYLIGSRRNGALMVPSVFLVDNEPLSSLRGTIIVLKDLGFSDDEVIDWLLNTEPLMGQAPITSLRAGRKSEVRRIARTLI
ncbi:DNA-binding protein [Microbacterium sp. NC79]|nr:DNA-binding protein [Microbacterium sp. NC79]